MVSEVERIVGMENYISDGLPGIGGKLKEKPSDFVVDEISRGPKATDAGRFTIARIRAVNWESNKLIREIARNLRVDRARITFAGTKDKRAISTQLASIPAPGEKVTAMELPGVHIISAYSSNHPLRIGRLMGNKFDIMLRRLELSPEEITERTTAIQSNLDTINGYPNFFGIQRFGAIRPVTHTVGMKILQGKFEDAIVEYLGHLCKEEDRNTQDARRAVLHKRDYHEAFELFPKSYAFERMMLYHLTKRPEDHIGALRQLPMNLLMMFTHAYQSFLFNRIISRRIQIGMPINVPVEGDFILPETRYGLPSHSTKVKVTGRNIDMITKACLGHKAFVSGVIFGSESTYSDGEAGELERSIVEQEDIEPGDFVVPEIQECSSSGTRKEICAPIKGFSWEAGHGWARFLFSLNKGCYATSLLREFMKCSDIKCY